MPTSLEDRLIDHIAATHTDEAALIVEHLPRAAAADVLDALDGQHFAHLVDALPASTVAELLATRDPDVVGQRLALCRPYAAASVLRAMGAESSAPVLAALPAARRAELATLTRFAHDTAAALMEPAPPLIPEGATVERARARWAASPLRHTEAAVWLVDDDGRLVGELPAWALGTAPAADRVARHRQPPPPTVAADAAFDRLMADPIWTTRHTVPVLENERVVGALRWSALMRALRLRQRAGSSAETADALRDLYRVVARSLLPLRGQTPGDTP